MSPWLLGDSSRSSFQALRARAAASWTCMMRCRAACCRDSTTLRSASLAFSLMGRRLPIRSTILQTPTLHYLGVDLPYSC